MKNKFLAGIKVVLFTWTITGIAYSQRLSGKANNDPDSYRDQTKLEYLLADPAQLTPSGDPGFFYRNDINIKAVRNFIREFKNADHAKWFKLNNGFAVQFTMDGFNTKVYYDKKGNYESMIRSYSEAQMPREVRHQVKRTFYDFSICQVHEIIRDNNTIYIVTIEDKTSQKKIKVENGEMEVMFEWPKN